MWLANITDYIMFAIVTY